MLDHDRWMSVFEEVHKEVVKNQPQTEVGVIIAELVTHPTVMAQPDYDVLYALRILRDSSWDLPSAMGQLGWEGDLEEISMYKLTADQKLWLWEKFSRQENERQWFMEGDYDKNWDT